MLFVIALIGLVSTLAIPGLMRARGAAQSASALGTMRVVNSAQLSFAITCGLGFYSPDFPTLAVTPPGAADAFLAPELATGPTFVKAGYNFSMAGTSLRRRAGDLQRARGGSVSARATPRSPISWTHAAQGRFFGTNADGIIYEHTASLGGTMPESGGPLAGAPLK